jgi:hypothetical protein
MDTIVFAAAFEAGKSYLYAVSVFETTVQNNSASSSAATKLAPVVPHDEGKIGRFCMPLVAALEEAELLCTVVSGTGKDMIIPPQMPGPRIFSGA